MTSPLQHTIESSLNLFFWQTFKELNLFPDELLGTLCLVNCINARRIYNILGYSSFLKQGFYPSHTEFFSINSICYQITCQYRVINKTEFF